MGGHQNTKGAEALLLPIQILEQEINPFDNPRMKTVLLSLILWDSAGWTQAGHSCSNMSLGGPY